MSYTKAQQSRDWLFIFETAEGRRALSALFRENMLFGTTFDPESGKAAFNEGRRAVACDIVQSLSISPGDFDKIAQAMKEQL